MRARRAEVEQLVQRGGDHGAGERADVPDPEVAQWLPASSGPKARAGFMAPPVSPSAIRTSNAIVKPIAEPGDLLERAARVDGGREDDPDEEERQHASITTPAPEPMPESSAGAPRLPRSPPVREDPLEQQRREHRPAELDDPVDDGEHRRDAPRDDEAERDGRVEVAARDGPTAETITAITSPFASASVESRCAHIGGATGCRRRSARSPDELQGLPPTGR